MVILVLHMNLGWCSFMLLRLVIDKIILAFGRQPISNNVMYLCIDLSELAVGYHCADFLVIQLPWDASVYCLHPLDTWLCQSATFMTILKKYQ